MAVTSKPRRLAALPLRRWGGGSRESTLFRLAIAVVALHVIDDNFLQPQPGMAAEDHLVSGLVPLGVLGVVAWGYPRLTGVLRGALALVFGVLGIAAGIEAGYYTSKVGASGDDFTGLLAILAGAVLIGLGAVTMWRTRRMDGSRPRRYARRALLAVAGVVVAEVVLLPVGLGLAGGGLAVRLMAYRVYLLPVSVLALAAGFYLSYWRRIGPRWNKIVLWTATVLSVFLWSLPYIVR